MHQPDPSPPDTRPAARTDAFPLAGWLLVLLMTAAAFVVQGLGKGEAPESVDPASYTSPILKYFGRVSLAMEELASGGGMLGEMIGPSADQFEAEIQGASENPIDRLRGAIVLAELAKSGLDTPADDAEAGEGEPPVPAYRAELDALLELARAEPEEGASPDPYIYPEMERDLLTLEAIYAGRAGEVDDEARDGLVERHAWFGRLALTWGAGDDDAQRGAIRRDAMFTLNFLIVAVLTGLGGFAIGFVLFVVGAVMYMSGSLRPALPALVRTSRADGSALVETLGLFLAAFLLVSLLSVLIEHASGVSVTIPAMWLTLAVVAWPVIRGGDWGEVRRAIGWHAGRGALREVAAGIAGYLAGLPVVLVGLGVTLAFIRVTDAQPSHPTQEMLSGGLWSMIMLYSLACVWAPVVEETMFRGAFFGGMRLRTGRFFESALISSFVFAIIHPQGIVAVPALMSLAVVFCAIREWRGSIIGCAVAHSLNNAMLITLMIVLMG